MPTTKMKCLNYCKQTGGRASERANMQKRNTSNEEDPHAIVSMSKPSEIMDTILSIKGLTLNGGKNFQSIKTLVPLYLRRLVIASMSITYMKMDVTNMPTDEIIGMIGEYLWNLSDLVPAFSLIRVAIIRLRTYASPLVQRVPFILNREDVHKAANVLESIATIGYAARWMMMVKKASMSISNALDAITEHINETQAGEWHRDSPLDEGWLVTTEWKVDDLRKTINKSSILSAALIPDTINDGALFNVARAFYNEYSACIIKDSAGLGPSKDELAIPKEKPASWYLQNGFVPFLHRRVIKLNSNQTDKKWIDCRLVSLNVHECHAYWLSRGVMLNSPSAESTISWD